MSDTSALLGTGIALGFLLACAIAHANKGRIVEWWNRAGIDLDERDGIELRMPVQPICWSSGPRGGHDYAKRGGAWICRHCDDVVEIPGWQS